MAHNDKHIFNDTILNFIWKNIKPFHIRNQYSELLNLVGDQYRVQYPDLANLPNFLSKNYCLALTHFQEKCTACCIEKTLASLPDKIVEKAATNPIDTRECDKEATFFCAPVFEYERTYALNPPPNANEIILDLKTSGLTVGAVIWLYFYERMGIFKILGILMDDYNYRGKFTISGRRSTINYSVLMDTICTLYRLGMGSNLRDRICTYQRVLGVSIENNLGIESERNTGFMETFNKLIDYMLEYYKTKQLAQAIQAQSGIPQSRSSVATQTSIRDTIQLLKQQFEPLEYGRNQINTFLGIATVHATLCLLNLLRKEIGIPDQYERPEEFIPAAYDILVTKSPKPLNKTNRYIIYDNCASYGYRLLTDIEMIDLNKLKLIATGSTLDIWLNDIEGIVEGYNNAFKSVPEPVSSIV